jgi:formate C-acetyltransferase
MSFIILDAAEHINVSLNITLRVHDTMNQELFDKAVRLLITYKEAWPRFSGDNALVEGFCRLGYSKELARERIAVGCNWMSLPGMEYTVNDLFKVNFVKVFEIAWQTMMDRCGYPGLGGNIGSYTPMIKGSLRKVRETPSVNFLWNIFLEHLQKAVHVCADAVRFHLAIQADNEVELMLNLLSHGPLEKGLDVSHGGAQYYNLAIDGAGLGTVADAFTALEQRVETGNNLSWETLNMMLRTNWEGSQGEEFRRMMKSSRRYGSSTSGDAWGEKVSREFSAMVRGESSGGNVFIPGLFSWAKTHLLGRTVGATPDGRRYGDPITHGANPSPGFAEDAAVLAQTSIIARVQPGYGNTAPLQLEFDPFSLKEDPAELVKALILAHFDLGGTLININIFDKSKLLEAHKNPEKYPDLIVRVTGFTAYFCMLTPEFRQLVVNRILQN